MKILARDHNGFGLMLKRLEEDRFIWADAVLVPTLTAKSPIGVGDRLFVEQLNGADGHIDAHNNTAERALLGVAIGRKNYLHVGSDAGGHTAAVMYTLLGTAMTLPLESVPHSRVTN